MHAKPDLRVFLKWMIAGSGSVITAVITLNMIFLTLFLAWPILCWTGNLFLPQRWHPVALYAAVTVVGSILLIGSAEVSYSLSRNDLSRFDLNGDGSFDDREIAPEDREEFDRLIDENCRTPPIGAAPITAIWTLFTFAVLYGCERVIRPKLETPNDSLNQPASGTTPEDDSELNPYRPPNA